MNATKKLCLFLLGSATLGLFSCSKEKPEKIIRPVKTMEVGSSAFNGKIFPGYAEAEEYSYLAFRVGGMLLTFDVDEGQDVKAGQVLAILDTRDYDLKLSAAKANYEQAQSQVARYKRLLDKDAISRQEYEIAQATYENNKAIYDQAINDLDYTKLRAPFSGNIEQKYVENHQEVSAGSKILKLNNPEKIQFRFTIPETNAKYFDENVKCSVELDIQKGVFYNAKVTEIVSSSVGGSGIPVIIKINDPAYDPKKTRVLPGYACRVKLDIKDNSLNQIIAVPLSCIYTDPKTNQTSVWIVDAKTSTVHLTPVKTGELFGENDIQITSGIKQGDQIVTAGVTVLTEGETVKLMK